MPKFKVTATMDVGYEAVVEARNQAEAWQMAADSGGDDTPPVKPWKLGVPKVGHRKEPPRVKLVTRAKS